MRAIFTCVIFIFSSLAQAQDLVAWLKSNNPHNYFPSNAEYQILKPACNKKTCFKLISVYYVTDSLHGINRLAIFNNEGIYLGVFSGFPEAPINTDGAILLFPKSKYGSSISFQGKSPPSNAYIDGHNYEFEKAL